MHLSLLSDSFMSDRLRDGGAPIGGTSLGPTHKAGVMRGLIFMGAIAIPFALAYASGHRDVTDAPVGRSLSSYAP